MNFQDIQLGPAFSRNIIQENCGLFNKKWKIKFYFYQLFPYFGHKQAWLSVLNEKNANFNV